MSDYDPKPQPDQDPDMTVWDAGRGATGASPAGSDQQATKLSTDPAATIAFSGSRPPTPASFIVTSQAVLFAPGTVLGGRYEIVAQLGMGGMGAVYKAYDREVQRDIALKVIRPELAENPQILQRFKQELILAREVTHPNVVRIYDIGEAEGVKFITMKFVHGQDLGGLMTEGKGIEPERAAEIMYQVCEGLEAVHKQGIIHRDLKPGNIMLDEQGRVVLMDFGLARGMDGDGMTQTGAMLGTMQYMSPEQAKAAPLDQRSDIYTVGLIFYELLTGVSPYASESAITSLMKRTQERAKPVTAHVPGIPAALNDICSRCLEINPAQRFQNIGELLAAFDAWRSGTAPSQIAIAARRMQRRFTWKYAAAAGAVVVVLAGSVAIVPRLRLTSSGTVGGEHAPVSVLVSDFANLTGDPELDGTLEPMLNLALEGAKFINA
ncbi:MAG TPA: serine/threonine-protein kinase, partial [Terriglobales bacterium]